MPKITDRDLLQRLKEQQSYLTSEVSEYQSGKAPFAYKIAATLRTLFHKTNQSTPILPDLASRYGFDFKLRGRNVPADDHTILYIGFTIGAKDPKALLTRPFLIPKKFEDYWGEIVYIDPVARYTRKQLVLWASNKLGGAHVDPNIPNGLLRLVNGETKLVSQTHGEESIINQVTYEMGLEVLQALQRLAPYLDSRIT